MRIAEERRLAEEKRMQEEAERVEKLRLEEEARLKEQERLAELNRIEEEKAKAMALKIGKRIYMLYFMSYFKELILYTLSS